MIERSIRSLYQRRRSTSESCNVGSGVAAASSEMRERDNMVVVVVVVGDGQNVRDVKECERLER